MNHISAGNLKQACVKTLTAPELYQRKGFNGVRELQAIFGPAPCRKLALFTVYDSDDETTAMVEWQVAKNASARMQYRLSFEGNIILKQAVPGDNIVVGLGYKGDLHCIIFKMAHCAWQGKMTNWTRYC